MSPCPEPVWFGAEGPPRQDVESYIGLVRATAAAAGLQCVGGIPPCPRFRPCSQASTTTT